MRLLYYFDYFDYVEYCYAGESAVCLQGMCTGGRWGIVKDCQTPETAKCGAEAAYMCSACASSHGCLRDSSAFAILT